MATKQELNEIVDYILKSLGVFATLTVTWVVLDSLATITDAGFIGFLAALVFTSALGAMMAVVAFAGYLLIK
ncbi:hypothetical protein [Halorussus lipolyticus]|uniref:hypothetical protein n=1 Tax=Halorussus lipolyticus TaxID=3034024 RepID=UPI0023E7BE9A|nr:hypothetical protein [Halorussus sp. DT80]